MPPWLIPALAVAIAAETTIVTWAILTGRFVGRRESDERSIRRLDELIDAKADTARVDKLESRVGIDHTRRNEQHEEGNVLIGRLAERVRGLEVRAEEHGRTLDDIRRRLLGGAG